ncbi:hypothetical protein [Sphingomonas sp. 37zxx]|uniref:hypothetical protein n=1 Tax=Sphingomonas sp. 37zxx TaxID=1550073 RepID=UPI00053BF91B|nr:hypothetical protein [Sphingomonas sp. 37zxx]
MRQPMRADGYALFTIRANRFSTQIMHTSPMARYAYSPKPVADTDPVPIAVVASADDDMLDFGHWLLPAEPIPTSERWIRRLSSAMGPIAFIAACGAVVAFLA